jgi:tetratricopeptide (TPR) repeat protein
VLSDYAGRADVRAPAETAVGLTPSDPEAHYALANVFADSGDYAGAVKTYEEALTLRPRDYVLWKELGRAREETGDAEGAVEAYRRAVALAPNYAQPHWLLGNALLRAGRGAEAFAELRDAAGRDPSLYPNLVQTLWHASGRDPRRLADDVRPRGPEQTLVVIRFLIRQGATSEGMSLLRKSGTPPSEEWRGALLADLLAAEDFADAYEVWSGGRAATAGALTDGGFEGELRAGEEGFGWRFAREAGGVRLSLDADSPREGSRSLKAEYAGASDPNAAVVSQLMPVEPGARYRLSFSARTKELVTGGPPFVRVASASGPGETLAESPTLSAGRPDWQDFSVEFSAPRGASAVRVELKRRPCSTSPCPAFGSVWLDAFESRRL